MNAIAGIAGAVLNSLWQSAALALVVWVALRLLEYCWNAATRHVVWWIALAAVIALPWIPHRHAVPEAPSPQALAARSSFHIQLTPPLAPAVPEAPVTVTEKRRAVWPYVLLAVWAALLARGVLQVLRSYRQLRGVKQAAAFVCRLTRGELRTSRALASPVAAGFVHPAVIVPEELRAQLTVAEWDCVVLHESAHLARYDDWTNLIARLLEAVLALHPVARWILGRIEREREIACDEWVVARTGAARPYARTLARVVELRMAPAQSALATGLFARRSRLRARIEMLLRQGREFSVSVGRLPIVAAVVALMALGVAGALAPHWIAFAQRPEFEVSSVKLNTKNGDMQSTPVRSGDLITMHNVQVYSAIFYAYHLTAAYQMVNYPDLPEGFRWWDIDARIGRDATDDDVRLMMQSLLEDRFKLKVHREAREMQEYQVTLGKGKPRLVESFGDDPLKNTIDGRAVNVPSGQCWGTLWAEGTHLICHAATLDRIAKKVSDAFEAPAVDHTGLAGTYDLHILYMNDRQRQRLREGVEPAPTFEQAFSDATGLKIEKGKGPVEVLVIDHLEKASANQ